MDATIKALVWDGAIILGGLYLCFLVAAGVATVVEKFGGAPSAWHLPLTALCGLAVGLPVYYASHAYNHSRTLSVYAAIAVGFVTFAFARACVPTRLREPKLGGFRPFWVRIVPNWHQ